MIKDSVSVIITCYNLERFLGSAVRSVRGQTSLPLETIVIHDGCDRPTMHDGTHTVFRQENRGVAESRDEGVRISRGEWILFLDADDMLAENFIEECLRLKDKADIIYPNVLLWSWWGKKSPRPNMMWYASGRKITRQQMLEQNGIVVSSLMKKTTYQKLGGFDPSLPVFEDWDFWIRALDAGYTFRRANTYLKYRQRTNSRNRQNDRVRAYTLSQVRAKYGGYLEKTPPINATIRKHHGCKRTKGRPDRPKPLHHPTR